LAFGPCVSLAQPAEAADASQSQSLNPVRIEADRQAPLAIDEPTSTGSRLGLTPLETPASIEVLTGDTIRARGNVSVGGFASTSSLITNAPSSLRGRPAGRQALRFSDRQCCGAFGPV
jgi:iron complex outermembrane receptor protein